MQSSLSKMLWRNLSGLPVSPTDPRAGNSQGDDLSHIPLASIVVASEPPLSGAGQVAARIGDLPDPVVKTCACCQAEYTREQWLDLRFRGYQRFPSMVLELRDCGNPACISTMALEVEVEP
jgi:hypothetical protein